MVLLNHFTLFLDVDLYTTICARKSLNIEQSNVSLHLGINELYSAYKIF